MEEEAPDALEVAAQENEEDKAHEKEGSFTVILIKQSCMSIYKRLFILLFFMRDDLSLDAVVLSLLADERRAFISVELLEKTPQTRPQLRKKLEVAFPKIAELLAPWPRRSQFITEICDRSLTSLGLAGKVDAFVESIRGPVKGCAWFATERVNEIRPYVHFGFEMSNRLNLSLFSALGYLSGSTLDSVKNRTDILTEVYRQTEPGKPVKIMSLQSYVRYHNSVPYNHLEGLCSAGLVKLTRSNSIKVKEKTHYYWCSDIKPSEELARQINRCPSSNFLRLMDVLYAETKSEGCVSLYFKNIAEKSGYNQKGITRTLKILTRNNLAKAVSKNALMEIEITEKGKDFFEQFLEPLVVSLNGNHESERFVAARQKVQDGAESFLKQEHSCLINSIRRYAAIPKRGYER